MQSIHEFNQLRFAELAGMSSVRKGRQIIDSGAGNGDSKRHTHVAHHRQNAGGDSSKLQGGGTHRGTIHRTLKHTGAETTHCQPPYHIPSLGVRIQPAEHDQSHGQNEHSGESKSP